MTIEKYGFKVGEQVRTIHKTKMEDGTVVPVGSLMRIVAIVPKVRIIKPSLREPGQDGKEFFVNLMTPHVITLYRDNGPRVRCNFASIKKV